MGKRKNKKKRSVPAAKPQPENRSRIPGKLMPQLRKLSPALGVILLCSCTVFFASWINFLDLLKIDTWIETRFLKYAAAFTNEDLNPNLVLITAVEDSQGNGTLGSPSPMWRRYHTDLIEALARDENKAKVIAFDLFFEDSSDSDRDFGRAIKAATDSGTTVVLGVKTAPNGELTSSMLTPVLKKTLEERNWGFLDVGGHEKGSDALRQVRLAIEIDPDLPTWVEAQSSKVVPSFTVQVLRAALSQQVGTAYFAKDQSQLQLHGPEGQVVKAIPVDETLSYIISEREIAELEKISRPYWEVYRNLGNADYLQFFKDKIVIVGYKTHEDYRTVASGKRRYGVEIQTNALSDLLHSVQISRLKPIWSFLLITLMSLIGFLLGTRYRLLMRPTMPVQIGVVGFSFSIPILVVAVGLVYLFMTVVIFKFNRVLLAIPYHLAVLFLTFLLADQIASRKTHRPRK